MSEEEIPEEILNAGLLAGRKVYRAGYQLTHDPKVARMVDEAVEAALIAAAPIMAAETLEEAAEVFGAGEWLDAFSEHTVTDDVTAVQATTGWLRERAKSARA